MASITLILCPDSRWAWRRGHRPVEWPLASGGLGPQQAPGPLPSHWPLPDLPSLWPQGPGGGLKRPWELGYHYPALIRAHLVQWLGADLRVTPVPGEPALSR